MNSGLHHRYYDEVLGLKPPFGRAVSITHIPVAVESEPLNDVTKALLVKILSTVSLTDCPRFDIGGNTIPSLHRLRFTGLGGRSEEGGTVHWQLPTLSEMAGSGPQVNELKKSAWALLQKFMQENRK